MTMDFTKILSSTESYYSTKIKTHGASAHGVDWNSIDSQELRFDQLLKVCDTRTPFTISDYGCGYGALATYMRKRGYTFGYYGFDISADMLAYAKETHTAAQDVNFVADEAQLPLADYAIASGIFNVKQDATDDEWRRYMLHVLSRLDLLSLRGFAFNVLTAYSDKEKMRPNLYYADPLFVFDHCKRTYSRFVALLHDYPLYEFTILVHK